MNTNHIIGNSIRINLDEFERVEASPYYTCTTKGVFYHSMETDKHGNLQEKPPLRLSDPIYLIGRGVDNAGNHYRIIQWKDRINHQTLTAAINMADIGNNWANLQRLGITIHANRRKRELLADYLQGEGDHCPYIVTDKAGWHDSAYILPNGDILTAENAPNRIHYNGDKSQSSGYETKGTLEQWKETIACYSATSSRLALFIGASLAAPLMRLLDIEGGGFHLYGDSSDGKTTAAKVALSVWGNPDILKLTWEGTGHGFSNVAAARNDGLLILDEIGQAAPRVVAHTAYGVINGTSKIQGAKEGGNRAIRQWRVMLLSTGEKTLQSYTQTNGADWQAGQANRLPSIPANVGKGLGIYDRLYNHPNGAEQSEHLEHATAQAHGSAGRAFIQHILNDQTQAISEAQRLIHAFMDTLPPLTGQARRIGKRFALIAAALELAHQWQIIDHPAASLAIKQCFDDWHTLNGSGKYEDRRIIEQAEAFMQQYADSPRFTYWNNGDTDRDHAGYYRFSTQELNQQYPQQSDEQRQAYQEYWIIPAIFENEICQSYEPAKVCTVLHEIKWLQPSKENGKIRYKQKRYNKGRFYVLIGITPPEQASTESGTEPPT